jgi:hypothetical protein
MHQDFYSNRKVFFGDLHNHCGISYGHGPLEDALTNAALQLDFVSITGHAAWPDMEEGSMPPEVSEYHREGFRKLQQNLSHYIETINRADRPGTFTTFGGYELHSFRYGDYTILQKDPATPHILPENGDALLDFIRHSKAERDGIILMPHHIGYRTGFRGIDWNTYNPAASPLVEMISMHGCAESENSRFPYLHTMGPLDDRNTIQAGLSRGNIFGVTGSTDHHSAHPGSYGYGRTAVWAPELNRESLWRAFLNRRTYAVSGDRIECAFSVNGEPMGGIARESSGPRTLHLKVMGGDALSRVEILKNNRVWYQKNYLPGTPPVPETDKPVRGRVYIEMGWGEKGKNHPWNLKIHTRGLKRLSLEPRFRGIDVVDPLDRTGELFSFTTLEELSDQTLSIRTMTFGNATAVTAQTQGLSLELEGSPEGLIELVIDEKVHGIPLKRLFDSGKVMYTAGFLSPALKVHRFVPEADYSDVLIMEDQEKKAGDVYYARVVQQNGHSAWTSPGKVEG